MSRQAYIGVFEISKFMTFNQLWNVQDTYKDDGNGLLNPMYTAGYQLMADGLIEVPHLPHPTPSYF